MDAETRAKVERLRAVAYHTERQLRDIADREIERADALRVAIEALEADPGWKASTDA